MAIRSFVSAGPAAPVEDVVLQQREKRLHRGVVAGGADLAHRSDPCRSPGLAASGLVSGQEAASTTPAGGLGPELVKQLVRDYDAGESAAALCASYGLGKGTVLGLLAEQGTKMRGQGLPDDLPPEAKRLYVEEGWPLRQIAPRLGCSADAVRPGLLRVGVVLRKPWERGARPPT